MTDLDEYLKNIWDAKKEQPNEAKLPTKAVVENSPIDSKSTDTNKPFIDFLSKPLPIVGTLYHGNLAQAAQSLEQILGQKLNKDLSGKIFSSASNTFLTTIDDISQALNLLNKLPKQPTELTTKSNTRKLFFKSLLK